LTEPEVSGLQIFLFPILFEKLVELDYYVMAQTCLKQGKRRENMAKE
jgi:hypothetical protein